MNNHRIYIFGAHSRAQTLAAYLRYLYPKVVIEAFLYDNEEKNPGRIGEIPVVRISGEKLCTEYPTYIATRGIYHKDITEHLRQIGFETVCPVTVEMDRYLRNAYMKKYFADIGCEFLKFDNMTVLPDKISAAVYVAKSVFDKPLQQNQDNTLSFYEREIQTGAALTAERLPGCRVTDDTGENISDKNRQFCELTALYWIWKNAEEEIVGLVHYRRHFILPKDWTTRMQRHHIDVILPVPLYVAPSLEENFRQRHEAFVWDYTMQYIKEQDEQLYAKAKEFFKGNLYSPCNMFIMRREILHELCEWMFPILFHVAEKVGQREDSYQNRYPGFLSERLLTFFFEKNRSKYKVAYADKNFLY